MVARWSRTDTALASAACDMRAAGISTRKVEAVASDLGLESMDRSRVSRLCERLDGEVAELRAADLSPEERPYLWLDAANAPCREAGAPRSVALSTAVACSGSARRLEEEAFDGKRRAAQHMGRGYGPRGTALHHFS